jgi:radical SAM protein with 4Fe4S-binding SPASM domain
MIFKFISTLSFKKIVNFIKVLISYHLSGYLKTPIQWGSPVSISIEPTNCCNLQCPECPTGNKTTRRAKGYINLQFYKKIIEELKINLISLTLHFQGEPYMHPSFFEMIRFARNKNIFTTVSTNGHFLDRENAMQTVISGLDQVIISLDGATQDIYNSYRKGGNLDTVIDGIRNLVLWKKEFKSKTPEIILQFLVLKTNENQIELIKKIKTDTVADCLILKSAQILNFINGSDFIPENKKYSRYYKNTDGNYTIKNPLRNKCWRLWNSAVITWDGNVIPCCFDKNADFIMGNINSEAFIKIWKGSLYKDFRNQILKSRNAIPICNNCIEGIK